MNKTRIKIISDCNSVSYQAQYKIAWCWYDSYINLETLACFETIEEAQLHIDNWIVRQAEYQQKALLRKQKKKTRKISFVDYP